jgi:dihydroxyacetone kinase-like protein
MKKLLNAIEDLVPEALAGMAAAYPDLVHADLAANLLLRRRPSRPGKVALVSGGGSGHEPLHGGYVGFGMLDAACAGAIFTSPVPDQMLAATRAVDAGAGVLHIVKNYTGDVLNFEVAAELAAAEGVRVASVTISDDVAVRDSTYTSGRRGVGATVLAEKIAGAAAERGDDLEAVAGICRRVAAAARSMGMALTSCTVPAVGRPTFDLPDDQMEIGIGIHGEPGRYREPLAPARAVVERLAAPIIEDLALREGERVLALVNGMGATPLIELFVVFHDLARLLAGHGISIARSLVGNYITSLDMAGCSITLLRLDDEMQALWDAPVHTPALRWGM